MVVQPASSWVAVMEVVMAARAAWVATVCARGQTWAIRLKWASVVGKITNAGSFSGLFFFWIILGEVKLADKCMLFSLIDVFIVLRWEQVHGGWGGWKFFPPVHSEVRNLCLHFLQCHCALVHISGLAHKLNSQFCGRGRKEWELGRGGWAQTVKLTSGFGVMPFFFTWAIEEWWFGI